jgi:beta-glucosidase
VPAIVEAWYPGRAGGQAIADVLTGRVNPSGRLPVTFYESDAQLPRPVRPGGNSEMDKFTIDYSEGAAVGYKWMDARHLTPLFPFGHGLSYTSFDYGPISAAPGPNGGVRVHFTLRNSGQRRGMAVGEVYAWRIAPGTYTLMLGASSRDLRSNATITLAGLSLPSNWRPGLAAAAPPPQRGERGR